MRPTQWRRRLAALLPWLAGQSLAAFGAPSLANTAWAPSGYAGAAELRLIHAANVAPPGARSAVVVDLESDRSLYDQGAHQRLPPASTTKIMTALLTLEAGDLDASVTATPEAAAQEGTRMGVAAGQMFTVRQLLYGLLLPSGNDVAVLLAQHEGPGVPAFVARMNQRAADLGLRETHFVNPHGLDDPAHLSSAADLAQLARYVLFRYPFFDAIVATPTFTIPATPSHSAIALMNLNQLLGTYPGADGVKTGTTPAAGQSLVGAATRGGHRVMAVVLGSDDRYADIRPLLDHAFADWVWLTPAGLGSGSLAASPGDLGGTLVPAWEQKQVSLFLDADSGLAELGLFGRDFLAVPLVVPA